MPAPFHWLRAASVPQRRAVVAASLGWMLDSMDVMLFSLTLSGIQRDLHLSQANSGALLSLTLLSAAAGGIGFGYFADRYGRSRALTVSMLVYSVFTVACAFVHTGGELAACRILLGLGMGGEWAAGAALVAEVWPTRHRAKALALVQSSWAVGYALAAVVTGLIMPHFGWRPVFLVGAVPALVAVWIRRRVPETNAWQDFRVQVAKVPKPAGSLSQLFGRGLRKATIVTAGMNAATLFAWWGLFTWVPRFLSLPPAQGGRGLSIVQTSSWTFLMQIGTFMGYLLFGYFADTFGRKRTYIVYLLVAAALVPFYIHADTTAGLLLLGPLVGFFGTGYFSGFSVIASESFPTALRGTAMGLTYNSGRIVSAAAPYLVGYLADRHGISVALGIIPPAFLVAALIASALKEPSGELIEQVDLTHRS